MASRRPADPPPVRIDDEVIDFIAAGASPRLVADFRPSEATRRLVADLIAREKATGLTAAEAAELGHDCEIEHLMRLAKARARLQPGDE